uniref:Dual specificity phosphatase 21 n=1 Tax=Buteo japonicus TaxID=224669 RepID=A0A8B9Z1N0_9AVES
APQITSILYLGDTVATNSHLLLFSHHIGTYLRILVMDGPAARISRCFDSVAAKIHSVGTRGGWTLLRCTAGHHSASLAGAHAWVESCRPIIRPSNGFWQQLIHYEYKLFGVNRLQTVSSLSGMIPDVYENEGRWGLL